jgi:hypothetical protein
MHLDLFLHDRLLGVALLVELLRFEAAHLLCDRRVQVVATRLLFARALLVIKPAALPLAEELDVVALRHGCL